MKKNYFLFGLLMLLMAFVANDASGQRYVDVAPGVGTLNDAINGDTTATGERVDENTIYRLQRGIQAYYGLTGSVSNSGYPLTIMAAEGDEPMPFLQPRDEGDGSSRAFRPKGDIKLMGLHVTNLDQLGGLNDRIVRCSADDIRVEIDDCWFDQASQSFIRVDNPGMTFVITNSVISDIGLPKDPNNGRGIDDRGNDIDTVIIENSTFFNITSRVIRDDGGVIKYARVNNNTIVNVAQMGITFGPVGMLEMNGNLMMNAGFLPMDKDDDWFVLSADSVDGVAPMVTMTNNSAYMDTTKVTGYLNDTTVITPFMNETLMAAMEMADAPNFHMNIEFTDGAPFNDSMLIYKFDPTLDIDNTPGWVVPDIPAGGNDLYHLDVYYDFSYVNSKAAVAGPDNSQLGDPHWMAEAGMFEMVDFEMYYDRSFWSEFANAGDAYENLEVVENPDMTGNDSEGVLMFTVLDAADPWAGAWSDAYGKMEFTEEMHHMEMMVWKDVISNCGLKVEVGGTVTELKVPNTLTEEWEVITFDFSANIGETLTRLVIFPDFPDERTAGSVSYLDNINMILSPVGVEKHDAFSLSVYPNPASDQLNVQAKGMTSVTILDVLGKSVKTLSLQGVDRATLSVEDLSQGVYFITIEATGGSKTAKFLKK
jgi:hypothetical protein